MFEKLKEKIQPWIDNFVKSRTQQFIAGGIAAGLLCLIGILIGVCCWKRKQNKKKKKDQATTAGMDTVRKNVDPDQLCLELKTVQPGVETVLTADQRTQTTVEQGTQDQGTVDNVTDQRTREVTKETTVDQNTDVYTK